MHSFTGPKIGFLLIGLLALVPPLSSATSAEPVAGQSFSEQLVDAAMERTKHRVRYDGRYISIAYPNGDVPADIGVCTDVVIRSYRALGIDLQQLVHEDMKRAFSEYPSRRVWGLNSPDTNIDHRRVLNLQVFFTRHGQSLPVSRVANRYKPGDLVTWELASDGKGSKLPHIGIVSERPTPDGQRLQIIHNIGSGPVIEDILFEFQITGHYRYTGRN